MALRLRLPATSANLGPGFDALGLAMALYLEIDAQPAPEFSIDATGRDATLVGSLRQNLMLDSYRDLAPDASPLALRIANRIPLGMGCGSSAAAIVAGVMLANHFGNLGMSQNDIITEASRREGHPDNVAACVLGGMTASAMVDGQVTAVSFGESLPWRLILAVPPESLSTSKARALLPDSYSRADAVANVQSTALLVAAFALGRSDLLTVGTRDRLHQPYRAKACPLLDRLLPLAGSDGIFAVTLSGAGPSVLLITNPTAHTLDTIRGLGGEGIELLETGITGGAAAVQM